MEADFSGYATKAGLKCSDGRTITAEAFKQMNGARVPLVWQHVHSEPANVLGHAVLEARDDGVYAYGYFNNTTAGKNAKSLVIHNDIVALSIYANQLVEKSKRVLHGMIREVSLVLSGANPGALIDYVNVVHADGDVEVLADEAVIYTGLPLEHSNEDDDEEEIEHADTSSDPTVQEVYDSLSQQQKDVVAYMIGAALQAANDTAQHSDTQTEEDTDDNDNDEEGDLNGQEGSDMTHNVFEHHGADVSPKRQTLTHDQLSTIVEDAKKMGSFKESFLAHVVDYGIENIDFLFPDAKTLTNFPELVTRRMEWVSSVINGAKHNPFSRIKTISTDVTHNEARAKGYVKASLKKEEWFAFTKRVTTPTTIYKKQKLDREDIIDITDLDVVAWLKAEMRIMLDEEIARAVLVGDGREVFDDDKINETNIRPIAYDADFYAHKIIIPANTSGDALVEAIIRARPNYRGSGKPSLYCVEELLTDMLLVKDKMGRRLYTTQAELESALRVSSIVTVDVMEDLGTDGGDLLAILVNISDYTIGADKGGAISMFDDFDIDYNQNKYLMETRLSGALTKFKSAIVFSRAAGTLVAVVTVPTFNATTGVVTIPATTGVIYSMDGTVVAAGAQAAIGAGETTEISAAPAADYYFPHNVDHDWEFTRNA